MNDDVATLVRDVCSAVAGIGLRDRRAGDPPLADPVTGRVAITGAWNGAVTMAVGGPLAQLVAATMFGLPADRLGPLDVDDAVCELTNIVGGGVKALLPGPSQLSLPGVAAALEAARDGADALGAEVGGDTPGAGTGGDALVMPGRAGAGVGAERRAGTRLWFTDEAGRAVAVTVVPADLALRVPVAVAGADAVRAS